MSLRKLTAKQTRFVEEYLTDLNATKAAVRAGYCPRRAEAWGKKLLALPHMDAAVGVAKEARSLRVGVSQDRVVEELAAVGFAAMSDLCRWDASGVSLVESTRLTRGQVAAVAEIVESGTGKGAVRIKLHAKLKALEMLGRHLGMFTADSNRCEAGGESPGPEPLADDLAEHLHRLLDSTDDRSEEGRPEEE